MHRDTKYNRIITAVLKTGLLSVFVLYLTSVNLFHHIHIIDGQIVLHSHLYSGQKDKAPLHAHTNAEMQLIQHLMNVETTGSALPYYYITNFQEKPVTLYQETVQSVKLAVLPNKFFLRPPPIL